MPRRGKKISGSPAVGLGSATVGCFAGMTCIALFGPAMHVLKGKLHLGPMEAAWLIASPVASGSLMRVVFGAYADASGAVKPFVSSLALAACGVFGVAAVMQQLTAGDAHVEIGELSMGEGGGPSGGDEAPSGSVPSGAYSGLIALGVLAGFGIATFSVGVGQVAYWFPKSSQGSVLGLYGGIVCSAPGITTLILPHLIESVGLTMTYFSWACGIVVALLAYAACAQNSWYFQLRKKGLDVEEAKLQAQEFGQEIFPASNAFEGLRVAASIWQTWALVFLYFTTFGGMVSLTGWFPTYWHEVHDVKPTTAGSLTAIFSMGFGVVRASSGPITDRLGGEATLGLALSVMAAGALLITMSRDFNMDLVGEVMLSLGTGVSANAIFKLVPQEVPQAVGGAAGMVGGLGAFGGFVLTPCLATFAHARGKDGYSQGFVIFAGLAVLDMFITLAMRCAPRDDDSSSEEETEETTEFEDGFLDMPMKAQGGYAPDSQARMLTCQAA